VTQNLTGAIDGAAEEKRKNFFSWLILTAAASCLSQQRADSLQQDC